MTYKKNYLDTVSNDPEYSDQQTNGQASAIAIGLGGIAVVAALIGRKVGDLTLPFKTILFHVHLTQLITLHNNNRGVKMLIWTITS